MFGKQWYLHNEEFTTQYRDGERVLVTETFRQLPPPPANADGSVYLDQCGPLFVLVKIEFATGESFSLQADRTWLTESGQRLRELYTLFDGCEELNLAQYQLIAW